MRCQKCTLINEPEAFTCKSCGMSLRPTHTPPSFSSVSQNNGKGLKQGLAITSLVLGIVSVPLFCAGFLLAIPGIITGYKLTLTVTGDDSYESVMTPETTSSGGCSFFISEDGVVHFSTVPGKVADDTDPVLTPSGKR